MHVKRTLFCVFALIAAANCLTNIDLTGSEQKSASFRDDGYGFQTETTFSGDYLVAHGLDGSSSLANINIFKYDSQMDKYNLIAQFNVSVVMNFEPATNGKWFGTKDVNTGQCILFQLGATTPSDITPISFDCSTYSPHGMRIMPDDSLVLVHDKGVTTFVFDGTDWNLNNTLNAALTNNFPSKSYDLTDTHLVNWNNTGGFQIYARNQKLGWDLIEDHLTNQSYTYKLSGGPPIRTTLIDAQTVMLRSPYGNDPRDYTDPTNDGFVIILNKVGSTWTESIIRARDVPSVGPQSTFGWNAFALDSNNVFVAVPLENPNSVSRRNVEGFVATGAVYLMQRHPDGIWNATVGFTNNKVTDGKFGSGMGVNAGSVKMFQCDNPTYFSIFTCFPYTYKACNVMAPAVTCNEITSNDCDALNLSTLNVTALNVYTQTDTCDDVTVQYISHTRVNDKITVSLSFTRPMSPIATTCDATITCLAPPVAPVAAPVATVSTPTRKTSSAAQMSFAGVTLTLVAMFW